MISPEHQLQHTVYPYIDPSGRLASAASGLKVAVAGADRGCGNCTAKAFAQAGAAKLVLLGTDEPELASTADLIRGTGAACQIYAHHPSLSRAEIGSTCRQMLQEVEGCVDVLVNSAAISAPWKSFSSSSNAAKWWQTYEANFQGIQQTVAAVLPSMLSGSGGTIINIDSSNNFLTLPGASASNLRQASISRFTASLDTAHSTDGIRSFAVDSGRVKADLVSLQLPDLCNRYLTDSPELTAAVCVYLATRQADYLQGRTISAKWDMQHLLQSKNEIVEQNLFKAS